MGGSHRPRSQEQQSPLPELLMAVWILHRTSFLLLSKFRVFPWMQRAMETNMIFFSVFRWVSNTLCWLFLLVKRATFRVLKCHGNQHFAGR